MISSAAESKSLRILLSFAVGGLLGDVFLNLFPQAFSYSPIEPRSGELLHTKTLRKCFFFQISLEYLDGHPSMRTGLWILCGVLIFTIIEKIFSGYANSNKSNLQPKCIKTSSVKRNKENGKDNEICAGLHNGPCEIKHLPNGSDSELKSKGIKISGYLNLIANSIDNFTNGLAVAGSFLVSFHHGFLGLLAILCKK